MGPSKYLIRALSKPTQVDEALWEKWYVEEHVPETVSGGIGDRGALFRAHNEFSLQTKTPLDSGETKLHSAQLTHFNENPGDKTFCAVYQSKFEDYTKSAEMKNINRTSELFSGREFFPLAEWDARVYELIQDYNPDNLPDVAPPFTLHVQNEPADEADYHDFYENEHLGLLHKVPGYRRSQRYKLINRVIGAPEDTPRFMVIHEFDHLDALDGPELRAADASPNVHRVFGTAKSVNVRGFKRIYDQGYEKAT